MMRFIPIFSGGAAGVALSLLRAATAATLLLAAWRWLLSDAWPASAVILLAASLLVGLFTRTIAVLGALLLASLAVRAGGAVGAFLAFQGVQAFALALLGAGAYSIDARLFGRRVIRLDDDSDTIG